MNADSKNDPETYAIIGAAMEVHRELGSGFLEGVYQDALAVELTHRSIPFTREQKNSDTMVNPSRCWEPGAAATMARNLGPAL